MLVLYFVSRPSAIGIFKEPATHSWTETYERGKESYPTTKGNLREGPYYTFELVEWSLDSAQFEFGGYFPGCASTCPKLLGFSVGLREDCWAAVRVDDDAAELRVLVEDLELPRLKLWVGLIEGRAAREPASDWGIWGGQIRISEGCGRDGLMEYITP